MSIQYSMLEDDKILQEKTRVRGIRSTNVLTILLAFVNLML